MDGPNPAGIPRRSFTRFFADKLRPVIERVREGRRRAVKRAFLAAAAVFAAFFAVIYLFFAPYNQVLASHDITYWPLLVLIPATMAVIAFSMTYLLGLRSLVGDFRAALLGRMAEYVDPGVVYDVSGGPDAGEAAAGFLFPEGSARLAAKDGFRGRVDGMDVRFTEIRVAGEDAGRKTERSGVFFVARFDRRFRSFYLTAPLPPAIAPGTLAAGLRIGEDGVARLESPAKDRQTLLPAGASERMEPRLSPPVERELAGIAARRSGALYLSLRDDVLRAAILAPNPKPNAAGVFDSFDVNRCHEFCDDAAVCLQIAREAAADAALWK